MIKQLKAAGINVDESSGLVLSSNQPASDTSEEQPNPKMANNFVDLANETLNALTSQ